MSPLLLDTSSRIRREEVVGRLIMLDPLTIGIGAAIFLAFRNQGGSQFGVLTPEREEVYRNALEFLHDPLKLEELAVNYQKEG